MAPANALLKRPLRAFAWSGGDPFDRPVTPEVAGSSPVAPVKKGAGNSTFRVFGYRLHMLERKCVERVLERAAPAGRSPESQKAESPSRGLSAWKRAGRLPAWRTWVVPVAVPLTDRAIAAMD